MPGNSFGHIFRITTFGESHGEAFGVTIDGCPAGLEISRHEIQRELDRRKPGKDKFSSQRGEDDVVEILSGIFQGKTLGTPIALVIRNRDANSKSYEDFKNIYRPGHADYAYEAKYGVRDWRGGGRSSGRETLGRVAAAAIAKKILDKIGVSIAGYVVQIGKVKTGAVDEVFIETNSLRCPDSAVLRTMEQEIEDAKNAGDSVGGVIEVVAHSVPAGLGEPIFHKLSADLAHAFMTIPAAKGVEIGDGFACSQRRGSENNDEWVLDAAGRVVTRSNRCGGIIGGISTGADIVVRCAFKPPSSIAKLQRAMTNKGQETEIQISGRHDPCVCPRAVVVGEAMMALTLVDHYLINKTSRI